jgi:phosphoribosylaminoimidazole (AIR) synthetase
MYRVFNMGIGLCVIVAETDAARVCEIARRHGSKPHVIGRVVEGAARKVRLPRLGLVGDENGFAKE